MIKNIIASISLGTLLSVSSNSYAQTYTKPVATDLSKAEHSYFLAKQHLQDGVDCASTKNLSAVFKHYAKAKDEIDLEIQREPSDHEAYIFKVIILLGMSDCHLVKNNKTRALEYMESAAEAVSKVILLRPNDVVSQREAVLIQSQVGVLSYDIFQKDKALRAFEESVKLGEKLITNPDFDYSDHKDLIHGYLALATLSDDKEKKLKHLQRASCVTQEAIMTGKVPEKERHEIFGLVTLEHGRALIQSGVTQAEKNITCP